MSASVSGFLHWLASASIVRWSSNACGGGAVGGAGSRGAGCGERTGAGSDAPLARARRTLPTLAWRSAWRRTPRATRPRATAGCRTP
eukprot:5453274-Prymnesium_polylepis.1